MLHIGKSKRPAAEPDNGYHGRKQLPHAIHLKINRHSFCQIQQRKATRPAPDCGKNRHCCHNKTCCRNSHHCTPLPDGRNTEKNQPHHNRNPYRSQYPYRSIHLTFLLTGNLTCKAHEPSPAATGFCTSDSDPHPYGQAQHMRRSVCPVTIRTYPGLWKSRPPPAEKTCQAQYSKR